MSTRRWAMYASSDSDPDVAYALIWELRAGELYGSCACRAGVNRQWCKHLARTVPEIPVDLAETRLGRLMDERDACRAKFDALAKQLRAERKRELEAIGAQMQEFLPHLD